MRQSFLRWASNQFVFSGANKLFRSILNQNGIPVGPGNAFDILYRSASLVLQSGTPGFEYSRNDLNPNIRFVGPLLPYREKTDGLYKLPLEYQEFNRKILVTQGTVEKDIEKDYCAHIGSIQAFRRFGNCNHRGLQNAETKRKIS